MKKSSGFIFFRKIFLQSKSSVFSEENEPNLISLKCVQRSSKILKIDFGWRWGGVAHALGLCPRIFRLLGHWPTGHKVKNDHCSFEINFTATCSDSKNNKSSSSN